MKKVLKKLFYLLPESDGVRLVLLVGMMLLVSLLEIVGIGMIPLFVAILSQPEQILVFLEGYPLAEQMGITDLTGLFLMGSVILITVFIVKNALTAFYYYVEGRYVWNRYHYITEKLFRKYMEAPYTFHLYKNSAHVIRNVTEESRFLIMNFFLPGIRLVMNLLIVSFITLLLFWMEPLITLVSVLLLGGSGGVLIYLTRKKVDAYGQLSHDSRSELIRSAMESMNGLKDIRILRREEWFLNRFQAQLKTYSDSQIWWSLAYNSSKPLTETVAVTGILVISLLLYWSSGSLTGVLPLLTLFAVSMVRLLPAVRELIRDLNSMRFYQSTLEPLYSDMKAISSVDKLNTSEQQAKFRGGNSDLRKVTNHQTKKQQPVELSGTETEAGEILFENVCYRYPKAVEDVLTGITIRIPKSSVVSIAGETGCGKTTLIDLLMGLHTPDEGRILIGGLNNESWLQTFPNFVGYVPQTVYLRDDTLQRNIAFGISDDDIDPHRVRQAVETAQLGSLLKKLPEGFETRIGEQGVRLSGGERQRIGIARALYHDPKLLILDEATSALDSQTEKELLEAVERMRMGRTLILITHRTTLLEACDTIWYLEKGRVAGSGTLSALLKENKSFREMSLLNAT